MAQCLRTGTLESGCLGLNPKISCVTLGKLYKLSVPQCFSSAKWEHGYLSPSIVLRIKRVGAPTTLPGAREQWWLAWQEMLWLASLSWGIEWLLGRTKPKVRPRGKGKHKLFASVLHSHSGARLSPPPALTLSSLLLYPTSCPLGWPRSLGPECSSLAL